MNTGKLLVGVLVGAALGAALGILFAPEKGSVTRKKLMQKGEDLKDGLKQKFDEFLDKIGGEMEETMEEATESDEMSYPGGKA